VARFRDSNAGPPLGKSARRTSRPHQRAKEEKRPKRRVKTDGVKYS
jgi:hypothetical protein